VRVEIGTAIGREYENAYLVLKTNAQRTDADTFLNKQAVHQQLFDWWQSCLIINE
jgi:hypothetical protein